MASRYPTIKPLDYCYKPVRLVTNGDVQYVPCGKCGGCFLHKANLWSMRLGCEIEACPFSIFFTLTYDNKYLPTCRYLGEDVEEKLGRFKIFTPNHKDNIRWNGKEDVQRKEDFLLFKMPDSFTGVPASNYVCDTEYFAYSSKRDFQLYLKLLRKQIDETFTDKTKEEKKLSYFVISEYGAEKLRPHLHGVFFFYDAEVSEFMLYRGLYENWQMCRRDLFQLNAHYCDSGCRGYITQYLTCNSLLPQIYKDDRIKPWRLSSKNPAIGYSEYDKAKILEDVVIGNLEYRKDISRLNERFILRYPSAFGNRLFPKCYEYSTLDYNGLCAVYGIYLLPQGSGRTFSNEDMSDLSRRLLAFSHSSDTQAAMAALKASELLGWQLDTYLYALDMYYYKRAMYSLRYWYEWQNEHSSLEILQSYTNLYDWFNRYAHGTLSSHELDSFAWFLESFGYKGQFLGLYKLLDFGGVLNQKYVDEVSQIMDDMIKMPKFNEKFGFSPNSDSNFIV